MESTETYSKLFSEKAADLEQLADAVAGLSGGSLEECSRNLRSAWKGESGEMVLKRCEALRAQMDRTSADLRALAEELRGGRSRAYEN